LFAAKQAYPWRREVVLGKNEVVYDGARLFAPKQGCSAAAQGCLRRHKVIHGKTTLFAAIQLYPRRNKVIQDKTRFLCRKSTLRRDG
jgi:hypothetical protein